jgi:F-type H+-transporting ATPase subunit b
MISINATLVVQVILFLITLFFLNRLMIRPILRVVQKRTQVFQESKDQILALETETEDLKRRFSQLQKDARKHAFSESDQLKRAGNTQAGEYLDQSKVEATSIRADAETKAEAEKQKERPLLKNQAALLAEEIVEKLLERRI